MASEGPGANGLTQGWYKDQLVFYFDFNEAPLTAAADGSVPTSPIFVTFNVDPDQAGGGPASGFMAQGSSAQTHNVVATIPGDAGYSPLWGVHPYRNQYFDQVFDLTSAQAIDNFGHVANVNCPVVFVGDAPGNPATATKTVIDRFSDSAGSLFMRSANPDLPLPGEGRGLRYRPVHHPGVRPRRTGGSVLQLRRHAHGGPAPIFAFFYENGDPVPNQLNIVDVGAGGRGL